MTTPVDLAAASYLPIAYAVGGECIVLDHHLGQIKVVDPEDSEQVPVVLDASAMTARGLSMPAAVPTIDLEPID